MRIIVNILHANRKVTTLNGVTRYLIKNNHTLPHPYALFVLKIVLFTYKTLPLLLDQLFKVKLLLILRV